MVLLMLCKSHITIVLLSTTYNLLLQTTRKLQNPLYVEKDMASILAIYLSLARR
jgi:hypothetical protein